MAVAPAAVRLLERPEDVDALDLAPETGGADDPMVALLAQTTLSHDEWAGIVDRARERFPDLWMPNRSDLCFATTNRQAALKALAGRCDAVVVIGSRELLQYRGAGQGGRGVRLPPGGAGQRRVRAAGRPGRAPSG